MRTILLHGLGQTPDSWAAVAKSLDGEVLCPSLFSSARGAGADYQTLYRTFEGYCEELSGPARLCGLSLGGIVALRYAIEHPERVEALTLIGTPCAMPKRLLKFQNLIFRFLPQGMFREMGLSREDFISLTSSMMNLDLRKDLGKIACPCLVLCGERDRANRKAALELQKAIPKAELAWIPGAGHEANTDAPWELCEILKNFYENAM